jgi:hypothetical protein
MLIFKKSIAEMTPYERWQDDFIQFARLLSEIQACECLIDESWEELCQEMDLTSDELSDLFDRAQEAWEKIKAQLP